MQHSSVWMRTLGPALEGLNSGVIVIVTVVVIVAIASFISGSLLLLVLPFLI